MKRILIDINTYASWESCTVASWVEARRSGTDKELEQFLDLPCVYRGRGRP